MTSTQIRRRQLSEEQASGPYSGSCIVVPLTLGDLLAFDTGDTTGATLDHYTVTSAGFTYYNYSQYS